MNWPVNKPVVVAVVVYSSNCLSTSAFIIIIGIKQVSTHFVNNDWLSNAHAIS